MMARQMDDNTMGVIASNMATKSFEYKWINIFNEILSFNGFNEEMCRRIQVWL